MTGDCGLAEAGLTRRCAVAEKSGRALVKCRMERSPFWDERVFTLTLADGGEHIGAASYVYFTDRNGHRLGENEPAGSKPVQGFVESVVVKDEGDNFLVALPDGS